MHDFGAFVKLHESLSLIAMFILACIASLLRTERHSLTSVITGIIFSGFIAYSANLLLSDITVIDITENVRIVVVGIAAYLNRYIMDVLDNLAAKVSANPIQAAKDLFKIWKR